MSALRTGTETRCVLRRGRWTSKIISPSFIVHIQGVFVCSSMPLVRHRHDTGPWSGALRLSLVVLLVLMAVYLFVKYDRERYSTFDRYVEVHTIADHLKSGDLVLFQANDAGPTRRVLMFGRWTHVGVLHRRRSDNALFIFDGGYQRGYTRYPTQICNYQHSDTGGLMALRRLNRALEPWQEERLQEWIDARLTETLSEQTWQPAVPNERGEWNGALKRYNEFMFDVLTQQVPMCLSTHVFEQNVPFDRTRTFFCTDRLMHALKTIELVDTQTVPTCLLPNYFATTPRDTLNAIMRSSFYYESEIEVRCVL